MIGYNFIDDNGFFWRGNQGGLLPLSSPKENCGLDPITMRALLKKNDAFFIRWESGFDEMANTSWWHVIKSGEEHLDDLPKKTRYMIRKASKGYRARLVSLDEIIENGYKVYLSAYARYETHEPVFDEGKFVKAIKSLPVQTEFWAVYDGDDDMVGFSENFISGKTCFYVTMWFCPAAMKKFASYLLFHEMAKFYLNELDFDYISDGSRSLSHNTNIHAFLESKFNFRKAYARLHVVYAPWLEVFVTLAYPFRNMIDSLPFDMCKKATVLLKQEEIRRQCKKAEY